MRLKWKETLQYGPAAMVASALFFVAMGALIKAVGQDIPLFQITFFRALVSALLLGGILWRRGLLTAGRNQKLLLIRALSGFVAMSLNFYALAKVRLGDAAALNQSSPVFVMVLSWIFLGERFRRSYLLLGLLSFIGVLIILRPSGEVFNLAGVAGLAGAVFAAGAYVAIRRLHQTESFWTMTFYFMAVATLLSLPPMLRTWKTPTAVQWGLLLGSGLFGTMGQLLMTLAYKNAEASWVAPFSYIGVFLSFIFGTWWFGESLDIYNLVGAGLVVLGNVLLLLRRERRILPENPP